MPEGPLGAPRLSNFGPLSRSTSEEIQEHWEECPSTGKGAEICKEIKTVSLLILEGQKFFAHCSTLAEINSGQCTKVADEVAKSVDGVRVLKIGDNDHFWIEYDGRHYDAEVPTGVGDWRDFPFFSRVPKDATLSFAQMRADQVGEERPETLEDTLEDVTEQRL